MIIIDDVIEKRNLQEQVIKNQADIEWMLTQEGVLNEFGIRITDQISDISDLPTVDDYKEYHTGWEHGDCIAVGDEAPYELYILTRANGGHPNDYWFDLGVFPLPGPQGIQGIQGIQGEIGPAGPIGPQGIVGPRGVPGLGIYVVGSNLTPVTGLYTSVNYSDIDTNRTIQVKDLLIGTNAILGQITAISGGICQVLTITNLSGDYVMLDVYPVGAIYLSVNSTNPSSLFGGTWERIQDSFLLAAGSTYEAGETGGEATHVLTVDEMPSHNHPQITVDMGGQTQGNSRNVIENTWTTIQNDYYYSQMTGNSGGGQAHNNMPPYLAVYVWKRIA